MRQEKIDAEQAKLVAVGDLEEKEEDLGYIERADFKFVDNLLVRIHLITEVILVDRPCAMSV